MILLFAIFPLLASTTHFQEWVKTTSTDLKDKGEIVRTWIGPVQYVWIGDRNNPVVLCIQGAYGGWDQSLLIGENLLDQGFSVLAISRPGYLGSKFISSEILSNEDQARAMIDVLDALSIEQAAVIGFSAGAPVAFQIAKMFPKRVSRLVLESVGKPENDIPFYHFLNALVSYKLTTRDVSTIDFETYMLQLTVHSDFRSTAQKILAMDNCLPKDQLGKRIDFVLKDKKQKRFLKKLIFSWMPLSTRIDGIQNDLIATNLESWPRRSRFYKQFETPTVIVQAVNDSKDNYALAKYLHSQIYDSELISVEGCGHFIWLGPNTEAWESRVVNFLKQHVN